MTDDIVTRLREIADAEVYRTDISVGKLFAAANEIERLRADRDRWRKVALAEHWLRVQGHLGCNCLDEAVRGD